MQQECEAFWFMVTREARASFDFSLFISCVQILSFVYVFLICDQHSVIVDLHICRGELVLILTVMFSHR